MYTNQTQRGYITLLSVLIVGAVGVAIATTLLLQGTNRSRSSFALQQQAQARALADACAEEGLQQLADNNSFTGTAGLTLGAGECSYTVVDTGGSTRRVEATGTVGTIVQKARIEVSALSPQITLSSWQEVADF